MAAIRSKEAHRLKERVSAANAVRWRLKLAEQRWAQALELIRGAEALPGYSGPALADMAKVAQVISLLRNQVAAWSLDEQARRASRPRIASRADARLLRKMIVPAQRN